jgi:cytochrome c-type biogenesis protein CcmE
MINEGIGYLYTGYAAIALGWLLFILMLYQKQIKVEKELMNLMSLTDAPGKKDLIAKKKFFDRNPWLIPLSLTIIVLLLLSALFTSVPSQPNDEVNELLDGVADSFNKEITVVGVAGSTVSEDNDTKEIVFELVDREDKDKKILVKALNKPDDFYRGKELIVTGLLKQNEGSYVINSTAIDLDVSVNVNKIFATYTPIWLTIFMFLFYFQNKHRKIKIDLEKIEKMVISHGRKRK